MKRSEFLLRQGESIRCNRAELQVTQEEVAEAVGVSGSTVGQWERGEVIMSAYSEMLLRFYWRRKRKERAAAAADRQEAASASGAAGR